MSILSLLRGRPQALETAVSEILQARRALASPPKTLSQWVRGQGAMRDPRGYVRARGGISDDRGDARSFAGDFRGFASILSRNGKPLDDLTLGAHEAGYFPDRPTTRAFLDALENDMRGSRHVADLDAEDALRSARSTLSAYEEAGLNVRQRPSVLRRALQQMLNTPDPIDDIPFAWPLGLGLGSGVLGALSNRNGFTT